MYPDGIDIEVPVGTKWAYANHAFCLLGEIVARTEGRRIEEVLEQRVFGPLGMSNSDCWDQQRPDLTTGYHHAPDHDDLEEDDDRDDGRQITKGVHQLLRHGQRETRQTMLLTRGRIGFDGPARRG